jgi:hypothetical protein
MRWRPAKGCNRLNNLVPLAFNKTLGLDLTLQMLRCDFGSKGIYTGIENNHVSISSGA